MGCSILQKIKKKYLGVSFPNSNKNFKTIQIKDNIKEQYCIKNKINLIIIADQKYITAFYKNYYVMQGFATIILNRYDYAKRAILNIANELAAILR